VIEASPKQGVPEFIRCGDGQEIVAATLWDWCRFMRTESAYIELDSRREKPSVGSFKASSATNSSPTRSSMAPYALD
jgi:hypothetical protein